MKRWGPAVVVVVLLAATAIAFATTERQKLEKTPFAVVHVTKAFSPGKSSATITLKLRRPHLVTLQVVDSQDHVVGTLANQRGCLVAGAVHDEHRHVGPQRDDLAN